jgi:hypothetical protein
MQKLHESNGVSIDVVVRVRIVIRDHQIRFHLQRVVKSISDDGQGCVAHLKICCHKMRLEYSGVSEVVLDNDVRLKADVCVVGAGVVPTTSFITGLTLAKDGSVQVTAWPLLCIGARTLTRASAV